MLGKNKKHTWCRKYLKYGFFAFCLWLLLHFSLVFIENRTNSSHSLNKGVTEKSKFSNDAVKLSSVKQQNKGIDHNGGDVMKWRDVNHVNSSDSAPRRPVVKTSSGVAMQWLATYKQKLKCLKSDSVGILYMYHARKVILLSINN